MDGAHGEGHTLENFGRRGAHEDGHIVEKWRNLVVAGHMRRGIYLSNLPPVRVTYHLLRYGLKNNISTTIKRVMVNL